MNPSLKLLLSLLIAVEISFTRSWTVNLILVIASIIWLLINRVAYRKIGLLFIVPLLPALAIGISMRFGPTRDWTSSWF
ncbi:hypothetical protein [Secundilactobacillus oryzae]|uniref:hypothetical protein n=1 Tax=Secundilactobacillus oryzae TaxID=1202668 RepID=UPI000A459300